MQLIQAREDVFHDIPVDSNIAYRWYKEEITYSRPFLGSFGFRS